MSFSHYERTAIWRAYGKKCRYCSEEVADIDKMAVDHLIPETVSEERFEELKKLYGHSPEFTVHQYKNLVAACSNCNGIKSNLLANMHHSGVFQIYLLDGAKRSAQIESELGRLKNQDVMSMFVVYSRMALKDGQYADIKQTRSSRLRQLLESSICFCGNRIPCSIFAGPNLLKFRLPKSSGARISSE